MKRSAVPKPKKLLIVLLAAAITALVPGIMKGDAALLFAGAVLTGSALYGFALVFFIALICRKKNFTVQITTPVIEAVYPPPSGTQTNGGVSAAQLVNTGKRNAHYAPLFTRFRLALRTNGNKMQARIVNALLPPDFFDGKECTFYAPFRGAYYGMEDEIAIFDAAGFWEASVPVPAEEGARLLVTPAQTSVAADIPSNADGEPDGGTRSVRPGGDFGHRAYIPGDDPRRINWKLYGRFDELFVRERGRENSRSSVLSVILDTGCDSTLFAASSAADAVDALCSLALALAQKACAEGLEVNFVNTAPVEKASSGEDVKKWLAYPVPSPLDAGGMPEQYTALTTSNNFFYLALPRVFNKNVNNHRDSALDTFIGAKKKGVLVNLIFVVPKIINKERIKFAAEADALYYECKEGVYAAVIEA
ncbi:MAG: DUF58 domain-containing protein [Spirochaetaceae bacterium]|nr:DUF58 domain-containing protein [Spirochaetaceae bacterium]